jgi:hypothetical protein
MHIRIAVLALSAGMMQAQSGVPTTLSLELPAYINGPVWIHIQALQPAPYGDVQYPVGTAPDYFGCQDVEVRRDGTMLPRIPLPPSATSSGGGLMCGSIGLPGHEIGHKNRLPLHLKYRFDKLGVYEVRYTRWPGMPRTTSTAPVTQTAWTRIEIQPQQPWRPSPPPQDPAEALSDYLPGILGFPDDAHLYLVTDYLYHPSDIVRQYASLGLNYWPEAEINRRLTELLGTRGPSDVLVERTYRSPGAAYLILPHLQSTDPVLLRGATIGVTRLLFSDPPLLSAEVRARTEDALISAAENVLHNGDSQTGIDYAAALGGVHDPRARMLLWSFVDRDVVTEESLIAISWFKNPADLPRLASLLESPAHGDPMQTTYASIPYAIRNSYGDAALPVLESAIRNSGYVWVQTACARELVVAGRKSGFAFIAQAIEQNKIYRGEMVRYLQERFPELRGADDARVLGFLKSR